MTTKDVFTIDEWATITTAVTLVPAAMMVTDGIGLVETPKELYASAKAIEEFRSRPTTLPLIQEILAAIDNALVPDNDNVHNRETVLVRCAEAVTMLRRKATPEEVAAYTEVLIALAEKVAHASGSGLFGMGNKLSSEESTFLTQLQTLVQ